MVRVPRFINGADSAWFPSISQLEVASMASSRGRTASTPSTRPHESPRVSRVNGVRATQEELEEKGQSHFEDYRFVSRTELEELGGEAFVGTPQLRAHAHGFFVDARLYKRLRAAAAPYAYDDYKNQKVA